MGKRERRRDALSAALDTVISCVDQLTPEQAKALRKILKTREKRG